MEIKTPIDKIPTDKLVALPVLDMGHVLRVIHQHYRWIEAVKESKKKRHSYYMQWKVSKYG